MRSPGDTLKAGPYWEAHFHRWVRDIADQRVHGTISTMQSACTWHTNSRVGSNAGIPAAERSAPASARQKHSVGTPPVADSLRIADAISPPELLRPLFEYERLVGGRW